MKKISVTLALSLAIVIFILGMGTGYYFTPEYSAMNTQSKMDLGAADTLVDLRYLNAMISHHRGALLLAEQIATQTSRPELKQLATEIRTNEPKLIEELYGWKKAWYADTRSVRDPIVANLGTTDATVDLRFLNALIAHHEAGIRMTQEIRAKSSRTEVLNNADAVENFLQTTLVSLKQNRAEWFSI
jgi:uncharacterized protein (DUF305 family)